MISKILFKTRILVVDRSLNHDVISLMQILVRQIKFVRKMLL